MASARQTAGRSRVNWPPNSRLMWATPPILLVSQIVEIRTGRTELETYIKKRLCNLEPDETLGWIGTIPWRAIFTTNYDGAIEKLQAKTAMPPKLLSRSLQPRKSPPLTGDFRCRFITSTVDSVARKRPKSSLPKTTTPNFASSGK